MSRLIACILFALLSSNAFANKCGQLLFNKHGVWKKYKYAPLTITEGTDQYSSSRYSTGVSTEGTTSILDPGVTTGYSKGFQQSVSTKGECKWLGLFAVAEHRKEFIAQNIEVIKTELARGKGYFNDILVDSYFCGPNGEDRLRASIKADYVKRNLASINAKELEKEIDKIIKSRDDLNKVCGKFIAFSN